MIQIQLKLKLNKKQEGILEEWLLILFRVWNWAIRKIELDKVGKAYYKDTKVKFDRVGKICYTENTFKNLLAHHSKKLGIPSHTIQGILETAWRAWDRCYKQKAKKPKLKGARNKLHSIPFPDPISRPKDFRVKFPILGLLKYHKQEVPEGKIKCGRIIKRASGWYLCLFIDTKPQAIPHKKNKAVGIDPGFTTHLTTTDEELNQIARETKKDRFREIEERLKQAQKGKDKKLVSRLMERLKNRRKDDHHKLSRKLVENCEEIYFSKDNIQSISKKPKPQKKKNGKFKKSIRFGKSVSEAGHYQLRQMISYKCTASGRIFMEVESKDSTKTCSECKAKTGPTGKAGLSVRQWKCTECGAQHDRDKNAAENTLFCGKKITYEQKHPLLGSGRASSL